MSQIHEIVVLISQTDPYQFSQGNALVLKPKEQILIKVEAPFIDEISGLAII